MELLTGLWSQSALIWIAVTAFLVGLLIDVLRAGKIGWGWSFLSALARLAGFLLTILISMFVEVTADHEGIGNWDDD